MNSSSDQNSGAGAGPPVIEDRVYRVKETAELYFQGKVSPRLINALFHRGELRGFRVGSKILIYESGLDGYRRRQENQASPAAKPTPAPLPPPATPKQRRKRSAVGRDAYGSQVVSVRRLT